MNIKNDQFELSASRNNVCIVVTVYNPDRPSLIANLLSYANQAEALVICDNSDNDIYRQQVIAALDDIPNATYLAMGANIGIAAAQNRGISHGIALGYEYFIEIDQDSKLPPNFVEEISRSYARLVEEGHTVAGIGPVAVRDDGFVYDGQETNGRIVSVDKTLSSGFFFAKSTFERVGPKDESLFIDYVDWEWCWRASQYGLTTYVDRAISIGHMLGDGHRRILGFNVGLPAPIRHYYQYRNGLRLLLRRYVPLPWRLKRALIMALKLPVYAFLVGDGIKRRKYICKGVIDAFRRRTGKITP
jgi:rhamnosyltransferase